MTFFERFIYIFERNIGGQLAKGIKPYKATIDLLNVGWGQCQSKSYPFQKDKIFGFLINMIIKITSI